MCEVFAQVQVAYWQQQATTSKRMPSLCTLLPVAALTVLGRSHNHRLCQVWFRTNGIATLRVHMYLSSALTHSCGEGI